jgi:hypothetical protein
VSGAEGRVVDVNHDVRYASTHYYGQVLNEDGGTTPWRQGTKGLSVGGCYGGEAFYRRNELSVGKGSDPKLVRFLSPLGSVFLWGATK